MCNMTRELMGKLHIMVQWKTSQGGLMLFVKGEGRMFKFIKVGLSFRFNKSLVNLLLATSFKLVEETSFMITCF